MMMRKKGSLNLSIQAIVIIIIAFTVLTLGVVFVKGFFEDITGQKGKIFDTIAADIQDKLAQSNEPLYYPQRQLILAPGDDHVDGIGVKNTGDTGKSLKVQFYVKVGADFEKFNSEEDHTFSSGDKEFTAKLFWDDSVLLYKQGEGIAIPFTLTPPKKFGNYLFKVSVLEDGDENNVFASKTFFVKIG